MAPQTETQAPKEISKVDDLCNSIQKMETQFKQSLPPHIPVEKFVRVAMTAVRTSPDLVKDCTPASLFNAFIQAATDGLYPDGKEGAIVPYGSQGRWMPMVGGICKKARNSGEVKMMDAFIVCDNDEFNYWVDELGPHFKFVPKFGDRGKDKVTFAYAITKDGLLCESIDEDQMLAIELCCKQKNGPWAGKFKGEMKRKSALRRLAKYRLPTSTDLDSLVRREDDMYEFDPDDAKAPKPAGSSRLAQALNLKGKEQPEDAEVAAPTITPEEEAVMNDYATQMREAGSIQVLNSLANDYKANQHLSEESKAGLNGLYQQRVKQLAAAGGQG